MKEVILAKSAGFCFGVQRAMDTVYAEADKKNVYTYGPIIHNTEVVNELESKGVKAVNDISEIPKAVYESIKNSGAKIVDATCPFVLKIHKIVKDASAEGDQIVIIGNEKHPEVEGIMGWSETPVHVVDTVEKAEKLKLDKSKNVRKLYEICKTECQETFYIQTLSGLELDKLKSSDCIGITAGASTPNNIIEEVYTNVRRKLCTDVR